MAIASLTALRHLETSLAEEWPRLDVVFAATDYSVLDVRRDAGG